MDELNEGTVTQELDRLSILRGGIRGTIIGDALGVPVEFTSREDRHRDPVTEMRGYGTHNQPPGTWSDDSSMLLATLSSIVECGAVDYPDIMKRFRAWRFNGEYTPYGQVFDIGMTCGKAIAQYHDGDDPLLCGGRRSYDNGNGSLMRIMPVSLCFALQQGFWNSRGFELAVNVIHNVSCLTHAHPRSLMGCVIYTAICHELIYLGDRSVDEAVQTAISRTLQFYEDDPERFAEKNPDFSGEISENSYERLRDIEVFRQLPDSEIQSGGYIVHTLEAAVWCLLNSDSFAECVLKAVNLGDDTDTVAAVAGGLAGLFYGVDAILPEWWDTIASKDWIDGLIADFDRVLGRV